MPNSYMLFTASFHRILLQLLSDSRDPLVLAIAAHDIGEYVRHYGAGKRYIPFVTEL